MKKNILITFLSLFILISLLHATETKYQDVDTHVKALTIMPQNERVEIESNIPNLVNYLTSNASNDFEKARAIFYWITHSIRFDEIVLKEKIIPSRNLDFVLKNRIGVCQNYAQLFEEMATQAGLNAHYISGYAKILYEKKMLPHAWNSVLLDGKWYLVDTTWGAGKVDNNYNFHFFFDEFYFLPEPKNLIKTHFPRDEKWQLLDTAIDEDQFNNTPYTSSNFFRTKLMFKSEMPPILKVNDRLTIELSSPDDVSIVAQLIFAEKPQSKYLVNIERKQDGNHKIQVAFPFSGKYILKIYSKYDSEPEEYPLSISLNIEASNSDQIEENLYFPILDQEFIKNRGELIAPLMQILQKGERYTFKLDIPNAKKVIAVLKGEWIYFDKIKDSSVFTKEIEVDGDEIVIYANFGDANNLSYKGLLQYMIR